MKKLIMALPLLVFVFSADANEARQKHASKYAGQESRAIKSLSPEDIRELRRGGGWGLAKAAELNGVPGPAHLLEMKDKIPLKAGQIAAITEIYRKMKSGAVQQGEKLIALELALEKKFRDGSITDQSLRATLGAISKARNELRYIHLATHLKTPGILSADQIKKYNALRGYSDPDPCASIPDGHNAKMWRRHNGCN